MKNSGEFYLFRILGNITGLQRGHERCTPPFAEIWLKSFGLWVWNELALLSRL